MTMLKNIPNKIPPWPITDHKSTSCNSCMSRSAKPGNCNGKSVHRWLALQMWITSWGGSQWFQWIKSLRKKNRPGDPIQNAWCIEVVSNLEKVFFSKEPLLWLGNDWNTTKSSAKISVGVFKLTCSSVLVSQPSSTCLIPMHSAGKMLTILVVSKLVETLSKRSLFLRKDDHDWKMKSPQYAWGKQKLGARWWSALLCIFPRLKLATIFPDCFCRVRQCLWWHHCIRRTWTWTSRASGGFPETSCRIIRMEWNGLCSTIFNMIYRNYTHVDDNLVSMSGITRKKAWWMNTIDH